MKMLYLIRGVSGSGKTSLAKTLGCLPGASTHAADDFFYDKQGNYNFDVEKLNQAHRWCQFEVEYQMQARTPVNIVIVHNTFTRERELKPYLELAEEYNFPVTVLVVENRHGNKSVHEVPEAVLVRQTANLMRSIKL